MECLERKQKAKQLGDPLMDHGIMTFCGYIACVFLAALAGTIIWYIWIGKIDLRQLVSEANHDASMSRFQLLIFTFVVAIGLFELIEKAGAFPDIPQGVLTLLGISASTYAVSKGITYSQPSALLPNPTPESVLRAETAATSAQAHAQVAVQAANDANNAARSASTAETRSVGAAVVSRVGAVIAQDAATAASKSNQTE
jgi:hypothetical protein